MKKFRVAAIAVGVVAIAGITGGVAFAESGTEAAPYLQADRSTVRQGEDISFTGSCAGEMPSVNSEAFNGQAAIEQGEPFTARASIATVAPGEYTVHLRCGGGNPGVEPVVLTVA